MTGLALAKISANNHFPSKKTNKYYFLGGSLMSIFLMFYTLPISFDAFHVNLNFYCDHFWEIQFFIIYKRAIVF